MPGLLEPHLHTASSPSTPVPSLDTLCTRDTPLAPLTTIRLGGRADWFATPADVGQLSALVQACRRQQASLRILGGGSNVIIRDGGLRGVVARLGAGFRYCRIEGSRLTVGAATPTALVVSRALRAGLSGVEFMCGIPGVIGGAVASNAGTGRHAIAERIAGVVAMTADGSCRRYRADELEFRYRESPFQLNGEIVLEVELMLASSEPSRIRREIERLRDHRCATQPLRLPSAGCVFRNPPGDGAGRLIDSAGGKGLRVGGVSVSTQHANFIVNDRRGSARDAEELIHRVHQLVLDHHGVDLVLEVRLIGER